MAEQSSHNVVNSPESTSGSPLVDAASNPTPTQSAASGTQHSLSTEIKTDHLDPTNTASEHATEAQDATQNAQTGLDAAKIAADPSAGDAAPSAAHDLAPSSASHAEEKGGNAPSDVGSGPRDDASQQGDGHADGRSTPDVSIDASVNSDTEGSRADQAEKKDGPYHIRTDSVKKPTSFSKVTATKSFMNKIAPAAATPAPKIGEKLASPSPISALGQPTNKPRLVVKSGSALGNLQKARAGSVGASGPDASKVWNKNRPTPQAPPKQFTDEELKQQYGIHLATRLQTDDNGTDGKWADIDDEDEDWAPEAVVWMDGTKSTVTPQDAEPPQQEQKPAAPQVPTKPAEGVRPVLALKRSERPDQTMRILKPGAAATQIKQTGLSSASPGLDKVSLKAKSPATAPAKSPWAPVAKPETISPINPPMQQPPVHASLPSQDARSYEPAQAAPTREIAADTFDRSWREGEGGARELFNSSNGRYEPAPEGRRGSVKPEAGYRKPAVLQRPSHGAYGAPAEPSAAFQSRTSAQIDGSWGRRRGSSVSQGSLPPPRRMSTATRGSEVIEESGTASGQSMRSPQITRPEPAKPAFAQQSPWDQQLPPRPESGTDSATPAASTGAGVSATPMEDAVVYQKRMMQEKRELAKKRRQEEEEREETAKQERLKAKLASLGSAGKSKKEREAEAADAAAAAAATTEALTAEKTTEPVPASQPQPVKPAEALAVTTAALEAQHLPSAPEQVQRSQSEQELSAPLSPTQQGAGLSDKPFSTEQQQQKHAPRQHLSPRASARPPYQQPQSAYKAPTPSYPSPGDRHSQPFGRSPNLGNEAFRPWAKTMPGSNVWGTSGIGNGTFENGSNFAPLAMQPSPSLPPPPGMGRAPTSNRISPQNGFAQDTRSPSLQQQSVVEQQRSFPPPGMESRADPFAGQSRLNGVSPAPGMGRPAHPPGPIGPPSRTQQQQPRSDRISAWNSAAHGLPTQYSADITAAEERKTQQAEVVVQPSENRYKETFKLTKSNQGALGAPRKYDRTEYTIHDAQGSRSVSTLSPAPPTAQTQPSASFPTASPGEHDLWQQRSGESLVKIPDISQNPTHSGARQQQPPIGPPGAQQPSMTAYAGTANFPATPIAPSVSTKDISPPPPDTEGHPVNEGDVAHPHVKLPPPQAKVKLPPMSPRTAADLQAQQQDGSAMMPQQRPYNGWAPPGAAKPIVKNEAWQARFNGLFGRTHVQTETPPSPPKTPPKSQGAALAVASSSRALMDEQTAANRGGATVSLPQGKKFVTAEGFVVDMSEESVSKPMIENIFNEELSFGSMPKVRVPKKTNYNTSRYSAKAASAMKFNNSQLGRHGSDIVTGQDPYFWRNPQGIFVTIPGTIFRNKLIATPGVPPPTSRKSSHNQHNAKDQERQDSRKQSGKFSKNRAGKDASEPSTPATGMPVNEGFQKNRSQKPSRQPSNAPTNNAAAQTGATDASNSKPEGTERKKSNWSKPPRGGRQNATAAAAAGLANGTPSKSETAVTSG